jgi:hypothetical protein
METAEDVDDAVKAVDYYAKAFPGDIHGEELRWILAERIRYLSQQGSSEEVALRHLAQQQYELLVTSKGRFAAKAHDALANPSATGSGLHASLHLPGRKKGGLQAVDRVVGGSGTQTSTAKSTAHEVLILNQAEVIVRAGTLAQLTVGTVVTGRVAHPVKTNGIVAIPAGASCQLTVVSTDPSKTNVSLGLTSIEIGHRTYAVKTAAVQTPADQGTAPTTDRALAFHLDAPLVIER